MTLRFALVVLFLAGLSSSAFSQVRSGQSSSRIPGIDLDPRAYEFGHSATVIGDLDGDGIRELVVGDPRAGCTRSGPIPSPYPGSWNVQGSAWILFLNGGGAVRQGIRLGDGSGGEDPDMGCGFFSFGDCFPLQCYFICTGPNFGTDVAWIPDGRPMRGGRKCPFAPMPQVPPAAGGRIAVLEQATGCFGSTFGSWQGGRLWLLRPDASGRIVDATTIPLWGESIASLGDLNGDGIGDLAVGRPRLSVGSFSSGFPRVRGAVEICFLDCEDKISLSTRVPDGGYGDLGVRITPLGDLNGDGTCDLAVGSPWNGDGASGYPGSVQIWLLDRQGDLLSSHTIWGTSIGPSFSRVGFGAAMTMVDDQDGDGVDDLLIAAPGENALWLASLTSDGRSSNLRLVSPYMPTLEEPHKRASPRAYPLALATLDDGSVVMGGMNEIRIQRGLGSVRPRKR